MSISKLRLLTVALLLGCAAPPAVSTVSAQSYQCATAADGRAHSLQTYIVSVVTGRDTASTEDRTQLQLPQTTATKVSYVSRANTCRTAAQSFFRAIGRTLPTSGTIVVVVIKVSHNRYVVQVPGQTAGEFGVTVVFDSKWHSLATVVS